MKKLYAVATMAVLLCLACMVMSGTAFADDRCVDNGDGTVTDNGTGMMWQKATAGPMNWDAAMSYATGLSLGGHSGWRLPGYDELLNLYRSPCNSLMEVSWSLFWSSFTGGSNQPGAYIVSLNNGYMLYLEKSHIYFVRAVRAGQ